MSRKPREPRILARLTYLHARLLISTAAGIAVTLALSGVDWRTPTKLLAGWDVGVGLYLLLMHLAISGAPVNAIRRVVNLHGVLSFFFNVSVLALTVNMVSNLIKPG